MHFRNGSYTSENMMHDEEKHDGVARSASNHSQEDKELGAGGAVNDLEDIAIEDPEVLAGGIAPDSAAVKVAPASAGGKAHVTDVSSIPDGGLRAWMQVAGSFFLFFNSWGIVNTYGIYQTYYSIDILKDESESTIAWIGSIQIFLLLIVGCATGPVYDSGYFRHLLVTGSVLVVFGHMMLSLCKTFWQVLLAQAFCIGIGLGCLFIPSVAILATYFHRHLAAATGLAASGSSLGGVIYPIVLNQLIPKVGFAWSVRIVGFMALGTLFVSNLVMKVRVLPPSRRKMIDTTAFKHWAFLAFCIGTFVTFFGLWQPFFYVQEFAIVQQITSENLGFYLIPILNSASVFGRIFPNLIADKTGPINILVPCAVISGALILALIGITSEAAVIVFVLLFGFFSGSLVSLPPTCVVHLTPDRRYIGTRLGMMFSFVGVGALVGSPIGGAILGNNPTSQTWQNLWIFGGVLCMAGGLGMGVARGLHKGWKPFVRA